MKTMINIQFSSELHCFRLRTNMRMSEVEWMLYSIYRTWSETSIYAGLRPCSGDTGRSRVGLGVYIGL